MIDPNKIRDDAQYLLIDAYGELNISCYKKAKSILEEIIEKLNTCIVWETEKRTQVNDENNIGL